MCPFAHSRPLSHHFIFGASVPWRLLVSMLFWMRFRVSIGCQSVPCELKSWYMPLWGDFFDKSVTITPGEKFSTRKRIRCLYPFRLAPSAVLCYLRVVLFMQGFMYPWLTKDFYQFVSHVRTSPWPYIVSNWLKIKVNLSDPFVFLVWSWIDFDSLEHAFSQSLSFGSLEWTHELVSCSRIYIHTQRKVACTLYIIQMENK